MGNSNSTGYDNIDAMAVKHGIQYLYKPITYLVNKSITDSKFPARAGK